VHSHFGFNRRGHARFVHRCSTPFGSPFRLAGCTHIESGRDMTDGLRHMQSHRNPLHLMSHLLVSLGLRVSAALAGVGGWPSETIVSAYRIIGMSSQFGLHPLRMHSVAATSTTNSTSVQTLHHVRSVVTVALLALASQQVHGLSVHCDTSHTARRLTSAYT